MPNPTGREVAVTDPVLTDFASSFIRLNEGLYAANNVFPVIPVTDQEGKYYIFDDANWSTMYAAPRAPYTESEGGRYKITSATYSTTNWAVHKDLTREDVQKWDRNPALPDPWRNAARFVAEQLLLTREYNFAQAFFKTSVWTGGSYGTDIVGDPTPTGDEFLEWNDANSTPIEDIMDQADAMEETTGYRPNVLVLGRKVLRGLLRHPDITEVLASNERKIITEDMLPSILGIPTIRVLRPVYNTANWNATPNRTYMYNTRGALLAYANPNGDREQPSAGYTFAWTGLLGAGAYEPEEGIARIEIPLKKAWRVEGELASGHHIAAPKLGVFFSNAVAATF
jgi:hypothetical protein